MRFLHQKNGQRGVALVVVLWMSIILTVLVSSFANVIKSSIVIAGTENSILLHYAGIDSALEVAVFGIMDKKKKKVWLRPGRINKVRISGKDINIRIVDPKGLVDINRADRNMLRALFRRVTGNQSRSDEIVRQIIAKRTQKTAPTKIQNRSGARQISFRHIEDLLALPAMNADMFGKMSGIITVFSGQKKINPATAPREVLLSVPGLTGPFVADFLQKRKRDVEDTRNYTDIVTRSDGALALSKRDVHIIYVTAAWGKSSQLLGRRYVVAIGLDREKPFRILSWSDYRG